MASGSRCAPRGQCTLKRCQLHPMLSCGMKGSYPAKSKHTVQGHQLSGKHGRMQGALVHAKLVKRNKTHVHNLWGPLNVISIGRAQETRPMSSAKNHNAVSCVSSDFAVCNLPNERASSQAACSRWSRCRRQQPSPCAQAVGAKSSWRADWRFVYGMRDTLRMCQ